MHDLVAEFAKCKAKHVNRASAGSPQACINYKHTMVNAPIQSCPPIPQCLGSVNVQLIGLHKR